MPIRCWPDKEEWLASYFELLPEAPHGKGVKADTYVLRPLRPDAPQGGGGLLLAETMPVIKGYDLVSRRSETEPSVFDGMILRLPCRLAAGRRELLEEDGTAPGAAAWAGRSPTAPPPRGGNWISPCWSASPATRQAP